MLEAFMCALGVCLLPLRSLCSICGRNLCYI